MVTGPSASATLPRAAARLRVIAPFVKVNWRGVDVMPTLIHGTFASGAHWVSDDAPIARVAGTPRLPRDRTNIRLGWGQLSPRSPTSCRSTRHQSRHCRTGSAGPSPFLIAHSHGGNVALHTLQSESARKEVCGLICLNTPFLYVRRRSLLPLWLCLEAVQPIMLCVWLATAMFLFRYRDLYPGERLRPLFFAALWACGTHRLPAEPAVPAD